jgi:hypothetical protein
MVGVVRRRGRGSTLNRTSFAQTPVGGPTSSQGIVSAASSSSCAFDRSSTTTQHWSDPPRQMREYVFCCHRAWGPTGYGRVVAVCTSGDRRCITFPRLAPLDPSSDS